VHPGAHDLAYIAYLNSRILRLLKSHGGKP
jgi:hypothetical protein